MKGLDFGSAPTPVVESASEEEVSEGDSEDVSVADSDEQSDSEEDEESDDESEEEEERPTIVEKVEKAKKAERVEKVEQAKVEKTAPVKVATKVSPQADLDSTSGKVSLAIDSAHARSSPQHRHGLTSSLLSPLLPLLSSRSSRSSLPVCETRPLRCWKIFHH